MITFPKLFSPFVFEVQFKLGFIDLFLGFVKFLVSKGINGDWSVSTRIFCLSLLSLQLSPQEFQFQPLLNNCFPTEKIEEDIKIKDKNLTNLASSTICLSSPSGSGLSC